VGFGRLAQHLRIDRSVGSNGNSGTDPLQPFATVDYAVSQCTANKGDVVIVMPGHTETTTAVGLDVIGVTVIGLGFGRNRPALTATTDATDLVNVSAANCSLQNIRLVGAASGVHGAARHRGGGLLRSRDHLRARRDAARRGHGAGGSHRFLLEDCQWRGTAAGPALHQDRRQGRRLEDHSPRADYGGSSGLDTAFSSARSR
jgi:hypothetical protein